MMLPVIRVCAPKVDMKMERKEKDRTNQKKIVVENRGPRCLLCTYIGRSNPYPPLLNSAGQVSGRVLCRYLG
jgi:hypothetical protein